MQNFVAAAIGECWQKDQTRSDSLVCEGVMKSERVPQLWGFLVGGRADV